MIDVNNKKTVIFDFGDTLASTIPTYTDRIKIALRNLGFEFTDKNFFDVYNFADYQIYKNYISSGSTDSAVYQNVLFNTLRTGLKLEVAQEELKRLINIQLGSIGYRRELLEFAGDLLELLKSKDCKLAIISNNDGHTFEKCRDLGIDKYFEVIIDSTNIGMVKPDQNIYRYALSKLDTDADKAVYIGDLYGTDILGGINSGLDVLWFNHRKGKNYEKIDVRQFLKLKEVLETF